MTVAATRSAGERRRIEARVWPDFATRYPAAVPEKKKERRPVTAKGGRVTPKGGNVAPKGAHMPTSGRYTPPVPQEYKVSPRWVPIVMGILLIAGMLTIICNYLNLLPGDDPSNAYLLGGLGLITAGFIVATRWR
jgi:hypothetical protein